MIERNRVSIELDWSRLLGFDQANHDTAGARSASGLQGAKVGAKNHPETRDWRRRAIALGAKVGLKPASQRR